MIFGSCSRADYRNIEHEYIFHNLLPVRIDHWNRRFLEAPQNNWKPANCHKTTKGGRSYHLGQECKIVYHGQPQAVIYSAWCLNVPILRNFRKLTAKNTTKNSEICRFTASLTLRRQVLYAYQSLPKVYNLAKILNQFFRFLAKKLKFVLYNDYFTLCLGHWENKLSNLQLGQKQGVRQFQIFS